MSFDPNKIVDDYGRCIYYQVGDLKTTSKVLALEHAGGNLDQISYHWNEQELDQIQWDVAPTSSIDTLMSQAAHSIRNQYKKVNLFYSGGYDSHTIYETFVKNHLKIDCFIIWRREWYHGYSNLDYDTALESAAWIKNNVWPDLEIKTVDWKIEDVHQWYRTMKHDWIYHTGSVLRFSKNGRDLLSNLNEDYKRMLLDDGNTITVAGYEKPKLDLVDGNWYVSHIDTIMWTDMHCPAHHFYYRPEIYHQQAWAIAKWMETLPGFNHAMLHQIQNNAVGPDLYQEYNLALGRSKVFHQYNAGGEGKILYAGKSPRTVTDSAKFLQQSSIHEKDVYDYYDQGLAHIEKNYGHLLNGATFHGIFSKKYLIKPFEPVKQGIAIG